MNVRRYSWFCCAAAASLVAVHSEQASAQADCETPRMRREPVEVTPGSGTRGVSRLAPVRVRYSAGTTFGDPESLLVLRNRLTGVAVPGRVYADSEELTLVFLGDQAFLPMTEYEGEAIGPDGSISFQFTTGNQVDQQAPLFPIDERLGITASEVEKSCDTPDGGYRINVAFAPATDADGPPGDIEYLLFQTRGQGLESPIRRSRRRNIPTDEVTMAFVLTDEEASEPICVSVVAVDGVGNHKDSLPVECIDPIEGNYFAGLCTVSSPENEGDHDVVWFVLLWGTVLGLRFRRRGAA